MVESSQNVELARAKAKFRALSNLASSTTFENEAMVALAAAGKILTQYNLSISDIYQADENFVQDKLTVPGKRGNATFRLLVAIANFTDTKTWYESNPIMKTCDYNFFGLESDVMMAKFLCELIQRAIVNEWAKFQKSELYKSSQNKKGASKDFQDGMIGRISKRLREIKNEMNTEVREEFRKRDFQNTGTDLVVLKNGRLNVEYDKLNLGLTRGKSSRVVRSYTSFYGAGVNSANTVNLSRPLSDNSTRTLLLGNK